MTDYFTDQFNKRLGNYTGSRARPLDSSTTRVNLQARKKNAARASILREALEEQAKREKEKPQDVPVLQGDVDQLIKDSDGFSVGGLFDDFAKTTGLSHLAKIPGASTVGGIANTVGEQTLDAGARGLDIISRPVYGTFEAMKEHSESINEGQGHLGALDDIAGGFWSGLSGREKTGFGEVVEENAKRSASALSAAGFGPAWLNIGQGLNDLAEVKPGLAQNMKRGAGFAGELGLDPYNFVGVGLVSKVGKSGKAANKFTISDNARNIVWDTVHRNSPELARLLNKKKATSRTLPDGSKISPNLPRFNESVDDVIEKALDDSILEIQNGMAGGRILGGELMPYTVSAKVAESLRALNFNRFDQAVSKLRGSPGLTAADIKKLKIPEFQDEFLVQLNKTRRAKNPVKSIDDYFKNPTLSPTSIDGVIDRTVATIKSQFDDTLRTIQDDIYSGLEKSVVNVPGLKVGGKVVLPMDRVGKAYQAVRGKINSDGLDALSYGKKFPGRTALMNQRLRSLGIQKYERFHKQVKDVASDYTKAERKEISNAIVEGRDFADPRMQQGKVYVQQKYDEIWNEEVTSGVNKRHSSAPTARKASNYVYVYNRRGKRGAINRARQTNRQSVADVNALPDNAIQAAKDAGLHPVDDAFEALLLRQIKSNRDLSRAWFMEDLVDHYGIKANRLNTKALDGRKLTKVSHIVPDHLKRNMDAGDDWYLPDDIKQIYDNYLETISLGTSEDTASLLKTYDKLTRMFKASATVPYPGFHIRNAMGDVFMSSLDGVKFRDYSTLMRLLTNARRGKTAQIRIGSDHISFAQLEDLFRKNAASGGFYSTDLGVDQIAAKVNPNRIYSAVRGASESREDFFRMAHFVKALKDEYPPAAAKVGNKNTALRNAAEAATYRVNKALFDYGALTKIEKNGLRRLIPFYTYSRKVMPTLMEAALLSPKNLSRVNRFFIDEDTKDDSTNFDDRLVPDYAREIGYAKLTDEANPFILRSDFLPTSVLRDNTDFSSAQGFSQNLLQNLNPFVKGPAELAFGTTAFNNRPIESTSDYLSSALVPPLGPTTQLIDQVLGRSNKSNTEALLSNRFTLGLPIDQISDSQQLSSLYGLEDELYTQLNQVNDDIKSKGLRVYLSNRKGGASYRVRDEETGQILFETLNPEEAVEAAKTLADRKQEIPRDENVVVSRARD